MAAPSPLEKRVRMEMRNPTMSRQSIQQKLALWIALSGTITSMAMSAGTAWQRSAHWGDRLWFIPAALLTVLGAHILLAITAKQTGIGRCTAVALWLLCTISVLSNHAALFLLAQTRANEERANAVPDTHVRTTTAFTPKRSLSRIAAEEAQLKTELARTTAHPCGDSCTWVKVKRTTLTAQLVALATEAQEVRRWQTDQDRIAAQADDVLRRRDAARDDPVTGRLASWLGVTTARIDLVMATILALVIEGLACLSWDVWLRAKLVAPAAGKTPAGDLQRYDVVSSGQPDRASVTAEDDPDLWRVRRAVDSGELRPTVADIRKFLGCAQEKASHIRRMLGDVTQPPPIRRAAT
jgi:hypothetical protein